MLNITQLNVNDRISIRNRGVMGIVSHDVHVVMLHLRHLVKCCRAYFACSSLHAPLGERKFGRCLAYSPAVVHGIWQPTLARRTSRRMMRLTSVR